VLDIEQLPLGVLDSKLTQSAAIIVGSPVINQNILMPVYKLFSLINPYRDKGKLAGGFGSYGWSGENKEMIKTNLTALKLKYFGEGVFIKFGPNDDEKAQAIAQSWCSIRSQIHGTSERSFVQQPPLLL
jgi:flavorubredoxin